MRFAQLRNPLPCFSRNSLLASSNAHFFSLRGPHQGPAGPPAPDPGPRSAFHYREFSGAPFGSTTVDSPSFLFEKYRSAPLLVEHVPLLVEHVPYFQVRSTYFSKKSHTTPDQNGSSRAGLISGSAVHSSCVSA